MTRENRKYVIINSSEVDLVDFSQVNEDSQNTLSYSLDGTKTFVKFDGDTPSFLNGKTTYTHSEIRTILAGTDWTNDDRHEEDI